MRDMAIKDIMDGKVVSAWEDEEWIYIAFPWCTVSFPKEEWKSVKKDLKKLIEAK